MLHTRTQRLFSVLAALTAVGCRETSPTPSAPVTPVDRGPLSIGAVTTTFLIGRPGGRATPTPTVEVLDRFRRPFQGAVVKFVADGGSAISVASVTTGPGGTATCGAWTLAATERENTVVATVDGVGSVTFTAVGRPIALPLERYDLLTIAGQSLPITYSGGGRSWTIIEGHYELGRDLTFNFWHVWVFSDDPSRRRDSSLVSSMYSRQGASMMVISFPPSGTATGTIAGERLSIAYSAFLDWEPEVYVRAR